MKFLRVTSRWMVSFWTRVTLKRHVYRPSRSADAILKYLLFLLTVWKNCVRILVPKLRIKRSPLPPCYSPHPFVSLVPLPSPATVCWQYLLSVCYMLWRVNKKIETLLESTTMLWTVEAPAKNLRGLKLFLYFCVFWNLSSVAQIYSWRWQKFNLEPFSNFLLSRKKSGRWVGDLSVRKSVFFLYDVLYTLIRSRLKLNFQLM